MATYVLEQILSPQECAEIIELGTTKGIKKHDNVINSNAVEVDKSVRSTDIYFINDITFI